MVITSQEKLLWRAILSLATRINNEIHESGIAIDSVANQTDIDETEMAIKRLEELILGVKSERTNQLEN